MAGLGEQHWMEVGGLEMDTSAQKVEVDIPSHGMVRLCPFEANVVDEDPLSHGPRSGARAELRVVWLTGKLNICSEENG